MRPAEMFGVVVRSIGFLAMLSGASSTLMGLIAPAMLIVSIPSLLVGWWLMRSGADLVVRFAYPDEV